MKTLRITRGAFFLKVLTKQIEESIMDMKIDKGIVYAKN